MRPNHLAVIQQTGAAKTHILWTLGVIKWGIVLIFIPLLTLSVDVMSKFTCTNLSFRAIIIQHLDELYNVNIPAYMDLLQQCRGLLWSMMTTVFIFLSPQFLVNHSDAREIFIECSHCCTTLRFVALDEAHIHVQHRFMRCKLYSSPRFLATNRQWNDQLITLTATMPDSYLLLLPHLLTINSFTGNSLVCGSLNKFS